MKQISREAILTTFFKWKEKAVKVSRKPFIKVPSGQNDFASGVYFFPLLERGVTNEEDRRRRRLF